MAYRLPPLNALRLFEAAGRHLSFRLAAEELKITPSAVSHAMQSLENWLGCALFARTPRHLSLTDDGAAYLPQVRAALELLATASEGAAERRARGRLSVSVAPSFGLRWLIPNLSGFNARYPGIDVSVDTTHRQIEFPRDGVDVAIRMGSGDWPDLYATCLVVEDVVPVCAPSLAARIRSHSDLAGQTLLHVTKVTEDWAAWCRLAGAEAVDLSRGLRFDTIHMALEAAAQGLGIAIGRLPLVADDVAAGRLVPVLGPPQRSQTGYWLVTGRPSLARPDVASFRNWIRAELNGAVSPNT